MRPSLAACAVLAAGLACATVAMAEFRVDTQLGFGLNPDIGKTPQPKLVRPKPKHDDGHPHHRFRDRHGFPFYVVPGPYYRGHRAEQPAPPAAPPPTPPEEPPAAAASPEPPDPRGPAFAPARGVEPDDAPYTIGEPLPSTLPHVTLDWRRYDLPEPPPGRIYARIGRNVLLITAAGRIVERVLPQG